MITRMKKLTLLIYHKEYEAFLTQMQQLGVLHVQAAQDGSPSSPGLEEKLALTKHVHELAVRAENLSATSGEMPDNSPTQRKPSPALTMQTKNATRWNKNCNGCGRTKRPCARGAISTPRR